MNGKKLLRQFKGLDPVIFSMMPYAAMDNYCMFYGVLKLLGLLLNVFLFQQTLKIPSPKPRTTHHACDITNPTSTPLQNDFDAFLQVRTNSKSSSTKCAP